LGTGSLQLLIPVGLSFYVLQNISYLVDVFRKQIPPTNNLIDFALYLAYFPKLLAGPIERARTFLPKLAKPRIVDKNLLARSLVLIVVGYLRKVVIADSFMAGTPASILEESYNYGALELWGWLIIYAFALYNDFAGYTSIVRGVSGLFGIELSPNFNFPYFSRNFSEFWSRWHITLSQWLRDYIFFPLTRFLMARSPNRQSFLVLAVPPFVTMLASGFWHGMSWNMLLWGAVYGIYLTSERILSLRRGRPSAEQPGWRQGLAMLATFGLVTLAWVPFRLELPYAINYWLGLLEWGNMEIVHWRELLVGLLFLIPVVTLDWMQWRYQDEAFILRLPHPAQAFVLASVLFLIFIASPIEGGQPFVYQGF
jgi:alginate O-acetyltransferase complex protein AlgI